MFCDGGSILRVVYMGTPDIAAIVLKDFLTSEHEVVAVVTQPDRPKGRGKELAISPVKEAALAAGIPVYQPEKVKTKEFVDVLKELKPDIILVTAFGQLLSQEILDIPKYGCINVHASLLPKYRGAAPIQWVILNDEEKTGITIMYMDAGCDTGDMIMTEEVIIDKKETAGTLHDKLAEVAGPLLRKAVAALEEGTAVRTPQNHEESTYVKPLDKSMGKMDFTWSAKKLECLIRGMNPWPSAFTYYGGKLLKIWDADVVEETEFQISSELSTVPCGGVLYAEKDTLYIRTGQGILSIQELQLEGKKRMKTGEFLRGCKMEAGEILGR